MLRLLLLYCLLDLYRTRIVHFFYIQNFEIAQSIHMHSLVLIQVSAPNIPKYRNSIVLLHLRGILNSVESISHDVRVVQSPLKWLDLLDCNESAKVMNLRLRVHPVLLLPGEVKKFGTVINLLPESFFHPFLGLSDHLVLFEVI